MTESQSIDQSNGQSQASDDAVANRADAAEAARTLPDDFVDQLYDADPEETREWIDSLDSVVETRGPVRARYLLAKLLERANQKNLGAPPTIIRPIPSSGGLVAATGSPGRSSGITMAAMM